jgi:predicted O-linked N-acetylglucosamine transferase (SPINDLY family)
MSKLQELLLQSDYEQIIKRCQDSVAQESSIGDNYYYLLLAFLLNDNDEEVEKIYALGLKNVAVEDIYTKELYQVLKNESSRQEELKEYEIAFKIRQYMRQVFPQDFDNLVQISYLSLHLKTFTLQTLQDLDFTNLVQLGIASDDSLFQLIQNLAYSPIMQDSLGLISSCVRQARNVDGCIDVLLHLAVKFRLDIALKFLDMGLEVSPQNLKVLGCKVQLYTYNEQYDKAINLASNLVASFAENLLDKIVVNHLLLGALMSAGGKWEEAELIFHKHRALLAELIEQNLTDIPRSYYGYLSMGCFFAPYFQDTPQCNRTLQNQSLKLFQSNIDSSQSDLKQLFQSHHQSRKITLNGRKLKIGYLATSLRRHSVGWLARSLFQHFDRESFEIYGYFPEYKQGKDFLENWYVGQMHQVYRGGIDYWGDHSLVAEQIDHDDIDILVDLESLTSDLCCNILALKPANIQVTWLGWDASGIPAIDYYIADPYVLPENAQEYYSEKIWRLPQTYIAVDGFEVSIANLRRADLDIPDDAVVYFSSQKSYKRHPETVRAQLQIIRQVPNSYFLLKGLADENSIQNFFCEIAESEGVNRDRLKFLPYTSMEADHRANMAIADIVLDTYPYNGATTTMETLWMGIPMVTQVGEQFVSRNSYTMMMNAGITEGIAWNVQEYVEWGVRFGTDEALRKEVAWKLRQSRKTSPLWNGRQFAREMENAYRQMWKIHNGYN